MWKSWTDPPAPPGGSRSRPDAHRASATAQGRTVRPRLGDVEAAEGDAHRRPAAKGAEGRSGRAPDRHPGAGRGDLGPDPRPAVMGKLEPNLPQGVGRHPHRLDAGDDAATARPGAAADQAGGAGVGAERAAALAAVADGWAGEDA